MHRIASIFLTMFLLTGGANSNKAKAQQEVPGSVTRPHRARTYLGFDRNDYPGDAALDSLRQTFAFSGYWLNAPPGENSSSWRGERTILRAHGFGFLVLFNGRLDKQLKSPRNARLLGAGDAATAVK
ncbi:MAG: glycoside hydrolase domain-containing protein, partial [Candidatus Acidiferrales bacterium]